MHLGPLHPLALLVPRVIPRLPGAPFQRLPVSFSDGGRFRDDGPGVSGFTLQFVFPTVPFEQAISGTQNQIVLTVQLGRKPSDIQAPALS